MTYRVLFIIFFCTGLIPQLVFSQKNGKPKDCYRTTLSDKSKVFTRMQTNPNFKGGSDALLNYLMANINYQKLVNDLQQNQRVCNDTARVKFIIGREGIMSDLSVTMTKRHIFASEIFRVIKKSACHWNPADFGRYVNGWLQIDIYYSIDRRYNEVTFKVKVKDYDHITDN